MSTQSTKQSLVKIAMVATLAIALDAQGAVVNWESATAVSSVGDSIVDTTGTSLEAFNIGQGTNQTVNGVTFIGQSSGANNTYSDLTDFGSDASGTTFYQDGVIGSAFEGMMDSFAFTGTNPADIVLQNLTIGTQYRVQLFVSDDRNADTQSDSQTFTSGGSVSGDHTHGLSYSLIGTFTADAATQTISVAHFSKFPTQTQEPRFNGYQLRDVVIPTPAALPAGLALIGLAAMRRRRMKHPV